MKLLNSTAIHRPFAEAMFGLCLICFSVAVQANDFKVLAQYFSITTEGAESYPQDEDLPAEFHRYFKTIKDLNPQNAFQFGEANPRSILALKDYIQMVLDLGYIDQSAGLSVLRSATEGAAKFYRGKRVVWDSSDMTATTETFDTAATETPAKKAMEEPGSEFPDVIPEPDSKAQEIAKASEDEMMTRISQLEGQITGLVTRLDEYASETSTRNIEIEITTMYALLSRLREEIQDSSLAMQDNLDQVTQVIFSRLDEMSQKSQQRQPPNQVDEARLLQETGELRSLIEQLDLKISELQSNATQPTVSDFHFVKTPAVGQSLKPNTSIQIVEDSSKIEASSVPSTTEAEASNISDTEKTPVEFRVGLTSQHLKQDHGSLNTVMPTVSTRVERRRNQLQAEFGLTAFSGASSADFSDAFSSSNTSGYEASLSAGYVTGEFDNQDMVGRETVAGLNWTYTNTSGGSLVSSEESETYLFLEHSQGVEGIGTQHMFKATPTDIDNYLSYLFSVLLPLKLDTSNNGHIAIGLGWARDKSLDFSSRGVSFEYMTTFEGP